MIRPAAVTVVIPAYGEEPWLEPLVDALGRQSLSPTAIFVVHSGPGDPTSAVADRPLVRVWHQPDRLFAGAARNIGLAHAATDWVAFLDADVLPEPDWLATTLRAAQSEPSRFVVGAVDSGGTGGYWGKALWAMEFSTVHPYLPESAMIGGASANFMARRDMLLAAGGFPDAFRCAEDTVLFARLRHAGAVNWFCPRAAVRHRNLGGPGHFLRHTFRLGRWSAIARRTLPLRGAAATSFWPLALVIGIGRFLLSASRVVRWGRGFRSRFALLSPAVLLGCLSWNLGFFAGLGGPPQNASSALLGLRSMTDGTTRPLEGRA